MSEQNEMQEKASRIGQLVARDFQAAGLIATTHGSYVASAVERCALQVFAEQNSLKALRAMVQEMHDQAERFRIQNREYLNLPAERRGMHLVEAYKAVLTLIDTMSAKG
jgi:hypothetical protein